MTILSGVVHYSLRHLLFRSILVARENEELAGQITSHSGILEDALMRHNPPHTYRTLCSHPFAVLTVCLSLLLTIPSTAMSEEMPAKGTLIANGETVELPYVYVWRKKEGFYQPSDPTWGIIFTQRTLQPREIDGHASHSAWVYIGITQTKEFSKQGKLEVYSQSIKFSAESPGNVSGGNYPEIEITGLDSDLVSGRIWHAKPQKVFDNTFRFDLTFSTPLSDPDAPTIIGSPLPTGGGAPGQAYLTWTKTIHTGDIELLKSIMPSEQAAQFDGITPEEARKEVTFMQEMTPTNNVIVGGSSDGETAILQTEGTIDGNKVSIEVTMTKMGDFWILTNVSM